MKFNQEKLNKALVVVAEQIVAMNNEDFDDPNDIEDGCFVAIDVVHESLSVEVDRLISK